MATTSEQICERDSLAPDVFAAMPTCIRALYRAAYAADVEHVQEGAAYDPATGAFTPGPPYNNVGPEVNRYLIAAGAAPGEPWCASFVTCMLLDSGADRGDLPEGAASVHAWIEWAHSENNVLDTPQRGCAGLIVESATAGHMVFVSDVDGTSVHTIEGNTNEGGSRDGYGVFRRVRPISEFACFADLSSL